MFAFTDMTKAKNFKEVVELLQDNTKQAQAAMTELTTKTIEFQKTYFEALVQNNTKAFEQFSSMFAPLFKTSK